MGERGMNGLQVTNCKTEHLKGAKQMSSATRKRQQFHGAPYGSRTRLFRLKI